MTVTFAQESLFYVENASANTHPLKRKSHPRRLSRKTLTWPAPSRSGRRAPRRRSSSKRQPAGVRECGVDVVRARAFGDDKRRREKALGARNPLSSNQKPRAFSKGTAFSTYREVRAGRGAEVGDGLRLLLEDTLDGRGLVADGHDGRGGVLVRDTLDADAGVREA